MIRCVAAWLLIAFASAQAATSADDQSVIRRVITAQIEAFRRDDAAGAFGYATPGIQAAFGTPDNFLTMVRRGYQPVYRPRTVDFTTLEEVDGAEVQLVELIGPDGRAYTARYTVERQPDGGWLIAACELDGSRRNGV